MKTKLRDVLIWFFFYSGLVFLYRQWKRRQGPLVRVVCLHDVPDREWFESFMQLLTTRYHLLSPQQFEEGSFHAEKINILLTFDDGYQSWVDVVLPTLDSYKVRAIFFINSGLLDVHESPVDQAAYVSERLLLSPKETLSWAGARTIAEAGHEIGGHSVGHFNLATLTGRVLEREISDDVQKLRVQLRTDVRWFAYPFGQSQHYSSEAMRIVQQYYEQSFAAHSGFWKQQSTLIPRLCLPRDQAVPTIRYWIEGGYDILTRISKLNSA